jgi:putative addiction module antidote
MGGDARGSPSLAALAGDDGGNRGGAGGRLPEWIVPSRRVIRFVEHGEAAMKLEVKKIGNSTGLILPKELVVKLGLEPGATLYAAPDGEGGLRLTPYDPDFEHSMTLVDEIMDEYRDTLKELAK